MKQRQRELDKYLGVNTNVLVYYTWLTSIKRECLRREL